MLIRQPDIIHSTTESVERKFLEFFQFMGYTILPESPLVDENIKMSFVMSAGLRQVEKAMKPFSNMSSAKLVLIQTCFRHFDLVKNLGYSPYHLSLFRMAGAFQFGHIDRHARIAEIWKLLSEAYDIQSKSIWVTYYNGGNTFGYFPDPDLRTYQGWLDVGIPEHRIIGLKENIWKQSQLIDPLNPTKMGLSSEVFFDLGAHLACGPGCLPGCNCGRFVEFLNTLFIEIEQDPDGESSPIPLSQPFVEVVIGVERLAMILQGANSVFDVDSLSLVCKLLEEAAGRDTAKGASHKHQIRLMADHLRALLFLVADGAPQPGRGGRAYIMRKLARNLLTAQMLLELPVGHGERLSPVISNTLDLLVDFHLRERALPGQSISRMLGPDRDLLSASMTLLKYLEVEAGIFEETIHRALNKIDQMVKRRSVRFFSGAELLKLVTSNGIPETYLPHILDEKRIGYSWDEYMNARRVWQKNIGS